MYSAGPLGIVIERRKTSDVFHALKNETKIYKIIQKVKKKFTSGFVMEYIYSAI